MVIDELGVTSAVGNVAALARTHFVSYILCVCQPSQDDSLLPLAFPFPFSHSPPFLRISSL